MCHIKRDNGCINIERYCDIQGMTAIEIRVLCIIIYMYQYFEF